MLEPSELFPEVSNLYDFMSVHAGMLFDKERVDKYADAIARSVRQGDIVADIGTGTGLLAFLCLQAGAERVHAIERSSAIGWARLLADRHGFADKIVFHQKDSRDLHLPEKVDLIISELIGHVAFEEGMIESIYSAKKRFLVPGGRVIPQRVSLRVVPVSEKDVYPECIDCWQPIKGIDYRLLRDQAIKACYLTRLTDRDLMSEPRTFFSVDLHQNDMPTLNATHTFSACRSGTVNGIGLWFDAVLAPGVSLSSSPWTRTHWEQCFAPIAEPICVKQGDRISVELNMQLRIKSNDTFELSINLQKES